MKEPPEPPEPKPPATYDGLPAPRRYWAAATLMTALVLSVVDATIAHVALPDIAHDLNTTPAAAVWIANAYNLAVVMLLLPLAAIAELIGARRMFAIGLSVFTVASLWSALSTSLTMLTIGRVLQGIGGAAIMCLVGGFVRNIYPLKSLGMGMSLNATTVAVSSVIGPTLGSAILSVASWPWIFAVNVPIGLIALFGVRYLPDVPRNNVRFDKTSALVCMVALASFVLAVDMLISKPLRAGGLLLVFALSTVFLFRRARHQTAPLVPVDLLRIRQVGFAVAASWLTFAAQMATFVTMPFFFTAVMGRPAIEVGLLMASWPVGTALVSTLAGRASDKYSAAALSGIGAGAMVVGLVALLLLPLDASRLAIMACLLVAGMGFGFFQTPNNRSMLTAAPRSRSAAAGGLQATTRVFGQSFGTALVAVAFGLSVMQGPVVGLALAACCAALAVAVNWVRVKAMPHRSS